VWNGQVLLRELRERGYDGGYTLLTDWLRPQRQSAQTVAVRRFETPPGRHYDESGVMVRSGATLSLLARNPRRVLVCTLHNALQSFEPFDEARG
jgi:hypothetical protein